MRNISITAIEQPISDQHIDRYHNLLRTYKQKDIHWYRVWNGDGTINCHSFPAIKNVTNITNLVIDTYEILDMVNNSHIVLKNLSDWQLQSHELVQINRDEVILPTLIAFAILTFGKEVAAFRIGILLSELNN